MRRSRSRADSSNNSSGSGTQRTSSSFGVGWNVGLNLQELEKMLCFTLPSLLPLESLEDQMEITERFQGRFQSKSTKAKAALREASDWMTSLLSETSSKQLPTTIIAELHCYIGLIREIHGDTLGGIHSYTTALWLLSKARQSQELSHPNSKSHSTSSLPDPSASWRGSRSYTSSTTSSSTSTTMARSAAAAAASERALLQQLSVTMYRLGNAYGRQGDINKRRALMDKAQTLHDETLVSESLVAAGM